MKEKEITNHCLSSTKTIRLVYDTKWKGGYAKNKKKMTKNVSYSFSDGIAVSSLWAPPGIVA